MSQNVQSVIVSIDKRGQEMRKVSKYKLNNLLDSSFRRCLYFSHEHYLVSIAQGTGKLGIIGIYLDMVQNELTDSLHSATIAKQAKD
jgi:hypothetical protein